MKLAPISGDLVVKLALGVAVIGAAWWAVHKITGAAGEAFNGAVDAASEWADNLAHTTLNPASDQNVIYSGPSLPVPGLWLPVNSTLQTVTGTPDTVGTWLHRLLTNDDERVEAMLKGSGGATGSW